MILEEVEDKEEEENSDKSLRSRRTSIEEENEADDTSTKNANDDEEFEDEEEEATGIEQSKKNANDDEGMTMEEEEEYYSNNLEEAEAEEEEDNSEGSSTSRRASIEMENETEDTSPKNANDDEEFEDEEEKATGMEQSKKEEEEEVPVAAEVVNQEPANLEPQVVAPHAPIGQIVMDEALDMENINQEPANLEPQEAVCPFCQQEFSQKKAVEEHIEIHISRGGEEFRPLLKEVLKRSLNRRTGRLYLNKGMEVLHWYEEQDSNFKIDRLLYSLDTNCVFPPLWPYLDRDGATAADNKQAIAAYKFICKTVVNNFEARYGASDRFNLMEKKAFELDVKSKYYDAKAAAAITEEVTF